MVKKAGQGQQITSPPKLKYGKKTPEQEATEAKEAELEQLKKDETYKKDLSSARAKNKNPRSQNVRDKITQKLGLPKNRHERLAEKRFEKEQKAAAADRFTLDSDKEQNTSNAQATMDASNKGTASQYYKKNGANHKMQWYG